MKKVTRYLLQIAVGVIMTLVPSAFGQLTIPYADGSDGALNITNDTVIDLSQAVAGVWTNTSPAAGKGIYDPVQWAVVFKYSSVTLASGASLTFTNHPTHAPVVWLISGNVIINGSLNLDARYAEPGPGGFRGGSGAYYYSSSGLGPGGGFATSGTYLNYSYGNTNLVPLIGGSGGGAYSGYDGGGGGGAILIAASGSITINGSFHANGGGITYPAYGSGGAIRLVANQILGNGSIQAIGFNLNGDLGRIRFEANSVTNALTVYPVTLGVAPANPPMIFPPSSAPTVKVTSVAGWAAPADPKAVVAQSGTANGDLAIASTTAAVIQLETRNFPTNGTVSVYIRPLNGTAVVVPASFVSGDGNQATWQTSANLPIYSPLQNQPGYAVIQARAVVP